MDRYMTIVPRSRTALPANRQSGFTLIELAVVIAIVGLLAAGAVTSFGAIRTNTKIKETSAAIKDAERLLQVFLVNNQRLPCPADPVLNKSDAAYALEQRNITGTNCHSDRQIGVLGSYWGTFPALSMGIEPGEVVDGWGNQLFFVVVGSSTADDSLTDGVWSLNDDSNEIELWFNSNDDPLPSSTPRLIVDQGVVAVFSAGANQNGAFTLLGSRHNLPIAGSYNEVENQDGDIEFTTSDYSESPTKPFDDLILVLTEDDLVRPLAAVGDIETKYALTFSKMERVVDEIFRYAARQTDDPDGPSSYTPSGFELLTPVAAQCVGTGGPVQVAAVVPAEYAYTCNTNTRTVSRRIPQSDSNPDDIEADGGGRMDSTDAEAVPYLDVWLTQNDVKDAWGAYLVYDPETAPADTGGGVAVGLFSGSAASDPVFSLTSRGPDGATGGGDDIVISYSLGRALGRLSRMGLVVDQ